MMNLKNTKIYEIRRFAQQARAPFRALVGFNHFSSFLAVDEIAATLVDSFGLAGASQRRSA
jgi:hypothetical protein